MTVGSRRSGLNQNMALKEQYERALQDLTDLVDTAKDKMAADQRIIASSVEEVQNHLDKHKVQSTSYKGLRNISNQQCETLNTGSNAGVKLLREQLLLHHTFVCAGLCFLGVLPGSGVPHDSNRNVLQKNQWSDASQRESGPGGDTGRGSEGPQRGTQQRS